MISAAISTICSFTPGLWASAEIPDGNHDSETCQNLSGSDHADKPELADNNGDNEQ